MIEAYKVGISLVLNSNAPAALKEMATSFEIIDRMTKSAQTSVTAMAGGLRAMRDVGQAAATAWTKAAEAMERASRAAAAGAAAGIPRPAPAAAGVGAAGPAAGPAFTSPPAPPFMLLGNPYTPPSSNTGFMLSGPSYAGGNTGLASVGPRTPAGFASYSAANGGLAVSGGVGGGGGRGPIPLNFPSGGVPGVPGGGFGLGAAGMMWSALSPLAKGYMAFSIGRQAFNADMNAGAIQAGLLTQGFSNSQAAGAYNAAVATQQSVIGSSVIGNLNLIAKLMAVVQDPKAAVELLPEFAKLGVVLDQQGHSAEGEGMMAAIRAGEFRGVLTSRDEKTGEEKVDTVRLLKFIRGLQAVSSATHGQMGPAQVYQFLKSGGVTASMIDDESLFGDSMALQFAMGSSKAGTALQALGQQFGTGRMSKQAFAFMEMLGLAKEHSGSGIGYEIDPKLADQAQNRPTDFVMLTLLPKIKEYLKTKYGSDFVNATPEQQQRMEFRMASSLASRQTGANEIVEIIRNFLLIERDREAVHKRMGEDAFSIQAENNPALRAKAMSASWEAFEIAAMRLGDPALMSGMNIATNMLNKMADIANGFKADLHTPEGRSSWIDSAAWFMPGLHSIKALFSTETINVRVINGRDLADGLTDRIDRATNRPPQGMTGFDPRIAPPAGAFMQ